MPITRYSFSGQEEPEAGEVVLYEDHLAEVARLEHIISGAEAEIHRQAEEIARLKFEIAGGLESRKPRINAVIEGSDFVDHTEE